MKHRKLLLLIIFAAAVVITSIVAIVWRAPLVDVLPLSAQNVVKNSATAGAQTFREVFGGLAAEDSGDGSVAEIALDNGAGDGAVDIPSITTNGMVEKTTVIKNVAVAEPSPIVVKAAPEPPSTVAIDVPQPISPLSLCSFPPSLPATGSLSQTIMLNEIAWMGIASSGNAEWMELKNISGSDIDLSGWKITNASGKLKINFDAQDRIAHGGFFLLTRGSTTFPYAHSSQRAYSGDLRNAGDDLMILDPACAVSDFVGALEGGWSAGNNTTKQTMERDADGVGWHASVSPGGTPGAENSIVLPPAQYKATVTFQGESGAVVASDPAGMACTATQCVGNFMEGTKVSLTEQPATGAVFDGWTGACSGKAKCSFIVGGVTSITALFHVPIVVPSDPTPIVSVPPVDSGSDDPDPVVLDSPTPVATRILIAAVQIAGASSTNDFVKLYNPSSVAVELGGWKLRKKSQTGADYSLREIPANSTLAPGKYFIWANSSGGFAATIDADASSTETLAANNSIALIDAKGSVIDALAWGTGTGQYGEGAPYLTDPAAGEVLMRKIVDGTMADTGNNGDDFTLSKN